MNKPTDDRLQAAFDAARAAAEQMPSNEQQARARAQFLSEARGVSVAANGDMRHREQGSTLPDLTVQEGKRRMKQKYSRFTRLAAAILLGAILAGGLWASPSLRALAQEIINYFVQGESDEQGSSVFVGDPAEGAPQPERLTLDEIIAETEFDLRVPTFMPVPYDFFYATYFDGAANPVLYYKCPHEPWSFMISQDLREETVPFEVGASAVIEEVSIHDVVGQYVRGFWLTTIDTATLRTQEAAARELDEVVEIPATQIWSNDTDFQQLSWRDDGIDFRIQTAGFSAGETRNPCPLTKEDYVAIAEGLKPGSAVELPSP